MAKGIFAKNLRTAKVLAVLGITSALLAIPVFFLIPDGTGAGIETIRNIYLVWSLLLTPLVGILAAIKFPKPLSGLLVAIAVLVLSYGGFCATMIAAVIKGCYAGTC